MALSLPIHKSDGIEMISMITARNRAHEYFDTHVVPAVEEWRKAPTDIRLAMSAAVALNQMADHYWHGFASVDSGRVFHAENSKAFRAELANKNEDWALLRDVAEAHKHVKLNRPARAVTSAGQAFVISTGFGTTPYGTRPWGGTSSVVIELDNGRRVYFSATVDKVMELWATLLR